MFSRPYVFVSVCRKLLPRLCYDALEYGCDYLNIQTPGVFSHACFFFTERVLLQSFQPTLYSLIQFYVLGYEREADVAQ